MCGARKEPNRKAGKGGVIPHRPAAMTRWEKKVSLEDSAQEAKIKESKL